MNTFQIFQTSFGTDKIKQIFDMGLSVTMISHNHTIGQMGVGYDAYIGCTKCKTGDLKSNTFCKMAHSETFHTYEQFVRYKGNE